MKILFVTDARSPISKNWIQYFIKPENEIYIASTFDCDFDLPINGFEFTPVAFSSAKKKYSAPSSASSLTLNLRTAIRQSFGPLTIAFAANKLRNFIQKINPDLIHAMRIPYEGMLTAYALQNGRGNLAPTAPSAVLGGRLVTRPSFLI